MLKFLLNKNGIVDAFLFASHFVFAFVLLAISSVLYITFTSSPVSAYTASLSTSGTVTTNVTPNTEGDKSISINQDSVNVITDCRAGYNLTISSSVTDRNLYKDGNSANNTSGQYFTPVNGTAQLNNTTNQYGYSLTANTESGVFTPLPLPSAPTFIKTPSQTASQTDINDDIPVYYGVSAANTLNPGLYKLANSGTVLYQLTLDESCMAFTINFNANGGTGTMTNQDITVSTPTNLNANSFTAPAYGQSYQNAAGTTIPATAYTYWSFNGWNTRADGTGTAYTDEEQVTDLANSGETITLYAQWKGTETMRVNFNGNGLEFDNGATSNTVGYYNGCGQGVIHKNSHTSNINDDGTQIGTTKYDNNLATKDVITIPGASTLHAAITYGTEAGYDYLYVFQGEYTGSVTRNMSAGQLATYVGGSNTTTTVTLDIPGDTATFAFYSDGSGQYYGYYADIVGYDSNGDEVEGQVCTRELLSGEYKEPNVGTLRTFYGWSEDQSATTADYASANDVLKKLLGNNSETKTLYAVWRNNLTINYNANGGTGTTSSQTVAAGETIKLKSNGFTAPTNKQFRNWNTASDGSGTSYSASSNFTAPASVNYNQTLTLYAIWDDVYYISFNANESSVGATSGSATGTMTNQTVVRDKATNIKTSTFALTGYIFLGWNTKADGTGTFYSDGQKVTNLTATGNTITLYAVWSDGAYLDTGQNVNQKLKRLAGNSSADLTTQDNTITAIVRSNSLPNGFTPATENTISDSTSPYPIYAWYDSANTTIYYYSEATDIIMNKTSRTFFQQMRVLSNLSTISTWDTSKVTDMFNMFYYTGYSATTFTLDLSSWNTSSVTSMRQMFYSAGYNATTFTLDLSSWNTSSVANMQFMFSSAGEKATTWSVGDLSSWDTSSVTDMSTMFSYAGRSATTFTLDLSSWDTSSVTGMGNMFSYAGYNATTWSIGDLSDWDTSSVTGMGNMFSNAGYNATTWSIGDLSDWDTSSVTGMGSMFSSAGYSASSFTLDLSSWNTSKVTNMSYMFNSAGYNATTWSIGNLSSWNTSNVTDMSNMFYSAGRSATNWSIGNLSNWNTSRVRTMQGMFFWAGGSSTTWSIGDLSNWDTSNVTNMKQVFSCAGYNATTWSIGDLSSWNTSSATSLEELFDHAGYNATTWSIGDLSNWDTSNVTIMYGVFSYAGYSATTWSVGNLSSWNTSRVVNMSRMFHKVGYNATTFSLDLSSWDTSGVTNMSGMFFDTGRHATTFTLNLSNWNTSSVTNIADMFGSATGYYATTWSVTIPKTNNGTASGPITNTTSNLYGNTTSVTATPPSGRSFTIAN